MYTNTFWYRLSHSGHFGRRGPTEASGHHGCHGRGQIGCWIVTEAANWRFSNQRSLWYNIYREIRRTYRWIPLPPDHGTVLLLNSYPLLFYRLWIVQGLRVVLDWYLSPRSSMDIVDVSENELNSYLASLLPKLIFSCLFSSYSYVNILLENWCR